MGKAPEEIKSELKGMENAMGSINSRMERRCTREKRKIRKTMNDEECVIWKSRIRSS